MVIAWPLRYHRAASKKAARERPQSEGETMRLLIMIPLAALTASCGGEEPKAKAPERPQAFQAGQWTSNSRVTTFRQMDTGRPRLNLPVGTEISGEACIGAAEVQRPPVELFVGEGWNDCRWGQNYRIRNGRFTAGATCTRPGLPEPVNISVMATFTDTSYEGTVEFNTQLVSDGDVRVVLQARGERTGDCPAGGAGGNQSNAH
jgi:hypothetical protein